MPRAARASHRTRRTPPTRRRRGRAVHRGGGGGGTRRPRRCGDWAPLSAARRLQQQHWPRLRPGPPPPPTPRATRPSVPRRDEALYDSLSRQIRREVRIVWGCHRAALADVLCRFGGGGGGRRSGDGGSGGGGRRWKRRGGGRRGGERGGAGGGARGAVAAFGGRLAPKRSRSSGTRCRRRERGALAQTVAVEQLLELQLQGAPPPPRRAVAGAADAECRRRRRRRRRRPRRRPRPRWISPTRAICTTPKGTRALPTRPMATRRMATSRSIPPRRRPPPSRRAPPPPAARPARRRPHRRPRRRPRCRRRSKHPPSTPPPCRRRRRHARFPRRDARGGAGAAAAVAGAADAGEFIDDVQLDDTPEWLSSAAAILEATPTRAAAPAVAQAQPERRTRVVLQAQMRAARPPPAGQPRFPGTDSITLRRITRVLELAIGLRLRCLDSPFAGRSDRGAAGCATAPSSLSARHATPISALSAHSFGPLALRAMFSMWGPGEQKQSPWGTGLPPSARRKAAGVCREAGAGTAALQPQKAGAWAEPVAEPNTVLSAPLAVSRGQHRSARGPSRSRVSPPAPTAARAESRRCR